MNRLLTYLPTKLHNLVFNLTGWVLVEHFDLETNEHIRFEWRHQPGHDPRDLWFR